MKFGMQGWMFALAATALCFGVSSARAALVGYWNFNEGSGGTAFDQSGNGNNGALNGGVTYAAGPSALGAGTALSFNGTSGYVDVGNALPSSPLSLTGTSYTISWWMDATGGIASRRMINKDDGNDFSGGYSLYYNGFIGESHNNGNGNNDTVSFLSLNTWAHIAVVYDMAAGKRYTYQNGTLVGTYTITGGGLTADSGAGADPLWFGAIPVYGQYFTGALDDIAIWNQALNSTQIASLADASKTPLTVLPEPSASFILLGAGSLFLRRRTKRFSN